MVKLVNVLLSGKKGMFFTGVVSPILTFARVHIYIACMERLLNRFSGYGIRNRCGSWYPNRRFIGDCRSFHDQKIITVSLYVNQTKYRGLVCLWSRTDEQPRVISIKAQDEYSFVLYSCWTMSIMYSSVPSFDPLLTDGFLWTTWRPC